MTDPHSSASRFLAQHKWLALYAGANDEPTIEADDGVIVLPLNYGGEILFTAGKLQVDPDDS